MKPTRIALIAAAAVTVAAAAQATASADTPPTTDAAVNTAAETAAEQRAAAAYWTPDRMRAAENMDLIAVDSGDVSDDLAVGEPRAVAPTGSPIEVNAFPFGGGPWTDGGDVVATSGRVFFNFNGSPSSCSGNSVTSDNGSTVLTAGHCVKYQGTWHTDWVFVPGYHDGEAPYGTWPAAQTLTTPQWEAGEDINYDVGAAVVAPVDGQRLAEVVGAQGVLFNGDYNLPVYSFGFPAEDPYDGESLTYCSGDSIQDPLLSDDHGLACDMTGGSSGGPWFAEFDESTGTGLQMSVNSFGYIFLPGYMFGPYFGAEAEALYDEASTA